MRVLQILPELNSGGVERGTLEVADYLVKMGHEALVVSNGGGLVEQLERSGARHITMPVHRKSIRSFLQIRPFKKLLEKEKPDILHIRSRVPGWIAYLAWCGMDKKTRPKIVTTVHGFYSMKRYSSIMTKGDRVIAVSKSIREYILKNYPSTDEDKITLIDRGIDPSIYPRGYHPSPEWLEQWQFDYPDLKGKTLLLLPGRITRLKGHKDFFELLAELKKLGYNVHGLVVGDIHSKKHTYYKELKTLSLSLGIDDVVTFTYHRSDVREIMSVSDVVCGLSQQPESFGRTVLEALALGKPVVGYDCGGVGEILAAFFPAGRVIFLDSKDLLKTIRKVIDSDAKPEDLAEAYTLNAMCHNTVKVYEELNSDH